mmetsp:Transcript_82760/g.208342  ORF Transcript_82760/g.208342 Transcript_82760/m.208342 type:complete len:213 (-) Transcript_82760:360-998(-)
MLRSKTLRPRWRFVCAASYDGNEAMMSTRFSAKYSARPSCPGSSRTVRLHRSIMRRSGRPPLSRSSAAPSTSLRKPLLSSGAPPVMSSTLTLGLSRSRNKHRSTTSSDIISFRSGEDSTWQCVQAWLQYKPMLICSTWQGLRSKLEMPASLRKRRKGGAPTLASACARRSTSSSGRMASAAMPAPDSSRSCKASGIKLVRCTACAEFLPQSF